MRDPLHIAILRLIVRLYPAEFRLRHGADIVASARASWHAARGARATLVVLDAIVTLGRLWSSRVLEAAGGGVARRAAAMFASDAALALRVVRRRPLQGTAIVITLALALGANAAIYTVAHEILLDHVPYDSPERIMQVTHAPVDIRRAPGGFTWVVGELLADHPGVEAAATYYQDAGANLITGAEASRVRITQVSASFFDVLGVRMLLGRGLDPEFGDGAVLSYGLWRDAFGADSAVLGRTIELSGHRYRITGVAPRGAEFPAGTQIWLPDPPVGEFFGLALGPSVVARVRPGARQAVQQALIEDAGARRADAGDAAQYIRDPELIPLRRHLTAEVRVPLLVLAGAAATVLLLGCINVAGISIARVAARAPELALRRALGAGRGRLFAQLLAETTVLAVAAGALSVLVAMAAVPALVRLLPAETPGLDEVRPDAWLLAFTGIATVAAAFIAGVPPAAAGVRSGAGGAHPDRLRGDTRGENRFQGVLTGVQVALAVVLVVTAALLGRTLAELRAVPLGYDTEGVLTFSVRLPKATYPDAAAMLRYAEDVRTRLAALPGVTAVGVADFLPLGEGLTAGARARRSGTPEEDEVGVTQISASRDYFAALGIDILDGRGFDPTDDAARTVILSRRLARALFGTTRAVGASVTVGGGRHKDDALVVGVVEDIQLRELGEDRLVLYRPLERTIVSSPGFAVRTRGSPTALAPAVRRAVAEVDPAVAPYRLMTMEVVVGETLAARRAAALIAILFGAASVLLALVAVHTLLVQSVARRYREIGVRMAVGATARSIEAAVVGRGLAWAAPGVAAGVLLSLAATRLLESMLFGVAPRDPRILAATALGLVTTAVLAAWLPARRAGRIDPSTALREST